MVKHTDYFLKFHEDFYQPIKEDIKISTIRDGTKPINVGDFVIATFAPSDKLLLLRIDEHYAMKLQDLGRNEAINEGYYHKDLLKHELRMIYPELSYDDYVYIYKFTNIREKRGNLESFRSSFVLDANKWVAKK